MRPGGLEHLHQVAGNLHIVLSPPELTLFYEKVVGAGQCLPARASLHQSAVASDTERHTPLVCVRTREWRNNKGPVLGHRP